MASLVLLGLVGCDDRSFGPTGRGESPGATKSIFSDDFESGTLAAWQDGMDPARQRIVTDPKQAQSGWLTHFLMPGGDSLYVSYYVRFPENWQGPTKLVALYGSRTDDQWSAFGKSGECPNGTDFFSAMLITEPGGNPGPTRFYSYYPGMAREPDGVTCWGRYGDGRNTDIAAARYAPSITLSRGSWHHIEFWVQLNTPGRADGNQTFWVDGEQWGSWPGIAFRNSAILRLNAVQLTFSLGTGVAQTQEMYVDNLSVRTAP